MSCYCHRTPKVYIAQRLTAELENVVCVEPNIPLDHFTKNYQPSTINHQLKLVTLEDALATSNVQVFLVAHKEFKTLSTNDNEPSTILDFCGVTNN